MIGRTYGYLTIIEFSHRIRKSNVYVCLCICGQKITRISSNLSIGIQNNSIISCGCNGRRQKNLYQCTKCNEWKKVTDYFKDTNTEKGHASSCKKCRLKYDKQRYENNPEVRKRQAKVKRKWIKKQELINPLFKIKRNMSRRLNLALHLKLYKKDTLFIKILGCSLEKLKLHLENQFQPGMMWENYGQKGWHIDHKIPLSSAKTKEELYQLCHYSNLQPLWACDNLSKGNKIWDLS